MLSGDPATWRECHFVSMDTLGFTHQAWRQWVALFLCSQVLLLPPSCSLAPVLTGANKEILAASIWSQPMKWGRKRPVTLNYFAQEDIADHTVCSLNWVFATMKIYVLVDSGCCNRMPQMEGLMKQKLIFAQDWRLKVLDQGANEVDFQWDHCSWLADGHLLSLSPRFIHTCGDRG